jgi:hypothetical protein
VTTKVVTSFLSHGLDYKVRYHVRGEVRLTFTSTKTSTTKNERGKIGWEEIRRKEVLQGPKESQRDDHSVVISSDQARSFA